ncbi:MAG: DUF3419 family protein [Bacteroidota bacterium]
MKSFLETVNYSSSNEDSDSEVRALQIDENDSILCITGSGARTLDLLIQKPALIVSIDINPCQNYLLELTMAAIRHLVYEEFLGFLGIKIYSYRESMYKMLREGLSGEARNFWDRHPDMIRDGPIYEGRWERFFRKMACLVRFSRPQLLARLFSCRDLPEQSKIWREEWNNASWRLFLRTVSHRSVSYKFFGDPGFYRHVPKDFSISTYLEERLTCAFENTLARESPFTMLLFHGQYDPGMILPPYLQEKNYYVLKNSLKKVKIITGSLLDYLERKNEEYFNKYSLSDFSSYTSVDEYKRIWKGIIRTAAPVARVCERQFLVKRELPIEVEPNVIRSGKLENELMQTDKSVFYSFVVASINNGEINV